ncbi:hypothetical protein SLS56_010881 [Neofusicoccum ribis]|uniref:Uncharacterized protein n=1 Tax=Neofusicoccum ribis TaxID=45134 RepID=A0ABR3SD86_9PEZI
MILSRIQPPTKFHMEASTPIWFIYFTSRHGQEPRNSNDELYLTEALLTIANITLTSSTRAQPTGGQGGARRNRLHQPKKMIAFDKRCNDSKKARRQGMLSAMPMSNDAREAFLHKESTERSARRKARVEEQDPDDYKENMRKWYEKKPGKKAAARAAMTSSSAAARSSSKAKQKVLNQKAKEKRKAKLDGMSQKEKDDFLDRTTSAAP